MIDNEQFITPYALLDKAAEFKGLTVRQYTSPASLSAITMSVGSFPLDSQFKNTLISGGFYFNDRSDGILTIADHRSYSKHGDSNFWNLRNIDTDRDPHQVTTSLTLTISKLDRGVVLVPSIGMTRGITSAIHQPTNDRMLKILGGHFKDIPQILGEVLDAECRLVVLYHDLELAGIRSVAELFREKFSSDEIHRLSRTNSSPFNPSPANQDVAATYVPEQYQPDLFRKWDEQLQRFRSAIAA